MTRNERAKKFLHYEEDDGGVSGLAFWYIIAATGRLLELGYEEKINDLLEESLPKFLCYVDNGSEADVISYDERLANLLELYAKDGSSDPECLEYCVFHECNLDTGEILMFEQGDTEWKPSFMDAIHSILRYRSSNHDS